MLGRLRTVTAGPCGEIKPITLLQCLLRVLAYLEAESCRYRPLAGRSSFMQQTVQFCVGGASTSGIHENRCGAQATPHHLGWVLPCCHGSIDSNTERPMVFKVGMTE